MKIYFCDGCNESVPLSDIQSGRVTTIKGKLFCSACVPPNALEPGPRVALPATPRPGSAWGSRAASLLLLMLLVFFIWRDRDLLYDSAGDASDPASRTEGGRAALSDNLDRLSAKNLQLDADLARLTREVTSLRVDLESLRAADADHDRAASRLDEQIERLVEVQVEAGSIVERVQLLDGRATSMEQRFEALSDAVTAHEAQLSLAVFPNAAGTDSLATQVEEQAAAPDPVRLAEIESVRRLLLDEQADLRYDAIERVSLGRFEELIPELIQRVADSDMFVRMYAMEVLADFGTEDAVMPLFESIDDGNATIRRSASEALVRLLGYDPGYDYRASPAERSRVVEQWRKWYSER